jgi:16S rRNA (guanine1207-N2)-methyltransferase
MRSAPFQIQLKARSKGRQRIFSFRSSRGVRNPESVLSEEVLLLQGVDVENTSAVLSIDSRIGVPGCVLGDHARSGRTLMTESEARASLLSELNRRRNEISSGEVMLTSDIETDCIRKYDVATYVPKPEDPDHVVKQKIYEGVQNLRDDGRFFLSAEKQRAEDLRDFLGKFGDIEEKVKDDAKLLEISYPEQIRESGFLKEKKFEHSIKGEQCKFHTLEGFFDAEDLNMVEMLAREIEAEEDDLILDLGCGFGGVGIFAAKLYGAKPVFADRNSYNIRFTEENCDRNEVEDFSSVTDDGAENFHLKKFDRIAYQVDESLPDSIIQEDIEQCRRTLKQGGKLFVAHRKDYGAEKTLRKVFGDAQAQRREVDFQVSVAER